MENNNNYSDAVKLEAIKMRVKEMKKFYSHLFIYCIAVLLYVGKRYFDLPINFWPINFINEFFMWIWTFIIALEALQLFFKESLFGTNWEQRKIKEMLDREKSETTKWN